MPATYHIDHERAVVTVRVRGRADGRLVGATVEKLMADPQWTAAFDRLWDFREITELVVSLKDVKALVERVQQNLSGTPSGADAPRIALVVERDMDRGIALLTKSMMRDHTVDVFTDIEAAWAFLGKATP